MDITYKDKENIIFRITYNDNYLNIHLYSYRNPELGIMLQKNKILYMYILKNKKLECNQRSQSANNIDEPNQKDIDDYLDKINAKTTMLNLQKQYFGL